MKEVTGFIFFVFSSIFFIYLYICCSDRTNEKAAKIDAAEAALQGESLRIPAWIPAGNRAGTLWDVPGQEVALVAQSGWAGGGGSSAALSSAQGRESRGCD